MVTLLCDLLVPIYGATCTLLSYHSSHTCSTTGLPGMHRTSRLGIHPPDSLATQPCPVADPIVCSAAGRVLLECTSPPHSAECWQLRGGWPRGILVAGIRLAVHCTRDGDGALEHPHILQHHAAGPTSWLAARLPASGTAISHAYPMIVLRLFVRLSPACPAFIP